MAKVVKSCYPGRAYLGSRNPTAGETDSTGVRGEGREWDPEFECGLLPKRFRMLSGQN